MPSASGVYSLPAGYLAVTGQTIQPSQHNPPLEDIAAALTLRLSRDGTAPMTGSVKAIAGSAALPGYAFATDATTGTYKTTNGLGIAVGGLQVAEFTAAGMASGVRMLGEIIPWARVTCPALFVFPAGQTLSRTTYAALWAVAQIEIAAGSTFFNNGDGSTTFGIGDLRGRTIAAIDNMGGTDASRLTIGAVTSVRTTLGGAGGEAAHTLIAGEIPTITSTNGAQAISVAAAGNQTFPAIAGGNAVGTAAVVGGGSIFVPTSPVNAWGSQNISSGNNSISVTSNNTGSAAHNNMQPTMLCNFIMFAGA